MPSVVDRKIGVTTRLTFAAMADLNKALMNFDATEANLVKLEALWKRIEALIPSGISYEGQSARAIEHESLCRDFRHILKHLPKLNDFSLPDRLLSLDEIANSRNELAWAGWHEQVVDIEAETFAQARALREYRWHFVKLRRNLVLTLVHEELENIEADISDLLVLLGQKRDEEKAKLISEQITGSIADLETLMGSVIPRPKEWGLFALMIDSPECILEPRAETLQGVWTDVKKAMVKALDTSSDPVFVEATDLGELVRSKPVGPVSVGLRWDAISAENFERLIFNLISQADGYTNAQWLTNTNAADKGRDLSVIRTTTDALSGPRRFRVVIQCKHWLTKSVSVEELSKLAAQMTLWEPPSVDELIVATSGTFSIDAVQWIEKHNDRRQNPHIEMWAQSHIESLLARHPHLIAEFGLRAALV